MAVVDKEILQLALKSVRIEKSKLKDKQVKLDKIEEEIESMMERAKSGRDWRLANRSLFEEEVDEVDKKDEEDGGYKNKVMAINPASGKHVQLWPAPKRKKAKPKK